MKSLTLHNLFLIFISIMIFCLQMRISLEYFQYWVNLVFSAVIAVSSLTYSASLESVRLLNSFFYMKIFTFLSFIHFTWLLSSLLVIILFDGIKTTFSNRKNAKDRLAFNVEGWCLPLANFASSAHYHPLWFCHHKRSLPHSLTP